MEDSEHLQATLAQLAGEGRVDSRGGFSVDLRRSVSKLAHFQHKYPHTFLRHLLSAAVALQAESFWMTLRGNRWLISFDGQELTFDDLKGIFPSLAASQPGRRGVASRELAQALNSLRGIESCRAVLSVPSGQLELTPTYLQVSPGVGPSRTQLDVRSLGLLDRLRFYGSEALLPQGLPDLNLNKIARLSRLAPLRRVLNEQELDKDLNWGPCLGVMRLIGNSPLPNLRFQARWTHEEAHSDELSLVVALYPSQKVSSTSILHWGLLYDKTDPRLPLEARVLAAHDRLKRDLQGEQLISDQTLQNLVVAIRRHVAIWGARLLARAAPSGPSSGDPELARLRADLKRIRTQFPEVGEIAGEALDAPLRLGGWPQPARPSEILQLHSRQGFIHLDPRSTSDETLAELHEICANVIEVMPYRRLSEGPYLLQLPYSDGEILLQLDGAEMPANTWRCTQQIRPFTGELPQGLGVELLQYPSLTDTSSWDLQFRRLAAVLATRLQGEGADEFLGSATALRLALWLGRERQCPQILTDFCLRLYPAGRAKLDSVLNAGSCPYVAQGREESYRGSGKPLLWLSAEEARILAEVPVRLREYGVPLERRLASISGRANLALEVVYEAVERCRATTGAFLYLGEGVRRPREGHLHLVAGVDLQAGALERWHDTRSRQPLLRSLRSRLKEPHWLGSAKRPDSPDLWSYVAAPVRLPDLTGLLLVAQAQGPFTELDAQALADLSRQACPLLDLS